MIFRGRAQQSRPAERKAMIDRRHAFPINGQARMLGLSRSTVYYKPRPVSAEDLKLMRRIDELHLDYPFAGARGGVGTTTLGLRPHFVAPTPPRFSS